MCLQTTAEEEVKWGTVVRTDHQFFQEFVDDNENTKSLAEATVNSMPGPEPNDTLPLTRGQAAAAAAAAEEARAADEAARAAADEAARVAAEEAAKVAAAETAKLVGEEKKEALPVIEELRNLLNNVVSRLSSLERTQKGTPTRPLEELVKPHGELVGVGVGAVKSPSFLSQDSLFTLETAATANLQVPVSELSSGAGAATASLQVPVSELSSGAGAATANLQVPVSELSSGAGVKEDTLGLRTAAKRIVGATHKPNKPTRLSKERLESDLRSLLLFAREVTEYAHEVGRQEDSAALFYSFLSDELKDRVSFQYSAELKSFESAGKTMPMEKVMSIVLRTSSLDPGPDSLRSFWRCQQGAGVPLHEYYDELVRYRQLIQLSSDPYLGSLTDDDVKQKLLHDTHPRLRTRTKHCLSIKPLLAQEDSAALLHMMAQLESQIKEEMAPMPVFAISSGSPYQGGGYSQGRTNQKRGRVMWKDLPVAKRQEIQALQRKWYSSQSSLTQLFAAPDKFTQLKQTCNRLGLGFPCLRYGHHDRCRNGEPCTVQDLISYGSYSK